MILWSSKVPGVVLILFTGTILSARPNCYASPAKPAREIATLFSERADDRVIAVAAMIQKGKITNPSVAARRLYNAWKKKSRKAGLKVASSAAVSKLFSTRWRPMQFKGCQNTGGSFECVYHDPKIDLDIAMVIEGGASAGYHVESVSFSSEAALIQDERPQSISLLWPE
ncbi:MAG: hypothetical protein H0W99_02970 [Acidobacteria bacterium]|jgi:hypothetical protein|nr:hypothetical protein [Acidobacteriota bacterium]